MKKDAKASFSYFIANVIINRLLHQPTTVVPANAGTQWRPVHRSTAFTTLGSNFRWNDNSEVRTGSSTG